MSKPTINTTLSDELAKKNKVLTGYERYDASKTQVFDHQKPTRINFDGTVDVLPSRFDRK